MKSLNGNAPRKRRKDFFRDGLSIDETRISVLIVLLIIFSSIAGYMYVKTGDFTTNMLQLLIALITAIAGVNIADSFANRPRRREYQDVYERPADEGEGPTI